MLRNGRDVDALVGIRVAYLAIDREPILQRWDAEHRLAFQVLTENLFANFWRSRGRGIALMMQHLVVEALRSLAVFFPPATQRAHVVRGDGGYRAVWIACRVGKLYAQILRHALNLQREDAQIVHHLWHTTWYHAQVFATHQHAGSTREARQLLHGLLTPEVVVTLVVVVIVQSIERLLLTIGKCLIHIVVLYGDARVEQVLMLTITYEEYIADEAVESLAHLDALCICLASEVGLHLALGVKLGTQLVKVVTLCRLQEMLLHIVGFLAKELWQEILVDERCGEELLTEGQSETLYLLTAHRQ